MTPGSTISVYVGGQGKNDQGCKAAGGFNGGGPTGTTCCGNSGAKAGSGGGSSYIAKMTKSSTQSGARTGNGQVKISW